MGTVELFSLLGGVGGAIAALVMALVVFKRNSDQTTNEETRLSLDTLVAAVKVTTEELDAANETATTLTIKLSRLEAQATLVLTENNRFRIIHGYRPAMSLDQYDPLDDAKFDAILQRLGVIND